VRSIIYFPAPQSGILKFCR